MNNFSTCLKLSSVGNLTYYYTQIQIYNAFQFTHSLDIIKQLVNRSLKCHFMACHMVKNVNLGLMPNFNFKVFLS